MARFPNDVTRRDPFRNFNFRIRFGDVEVAACRKMSPLTGKVEVAKFRAGSNRSSVDELLPGRTSYEPVTFEAGLTNDDAFKSWASVLVDNEWVTDNRANDPNFRREVEVLVFDLSNDTPVKKFTMHNSWVSSFTALSELAGEANEVLFESLEVQYEGFTEEALTA